jgi:predicted esterase
MAVRNPDPHGQQPILSAGKQPFDARLTMILVHGRGASAEDILSLTPELNASDVAYLAPQASGGTWYPYSFMAPNERNEPYLSSALGVLSRLVQSIADRGVGASRIALLGFSQGACLTLEYAARHAQRYAGVFGLSGALIGPPGTSRKYAGSLDGTPVFLGCSDVDPHIPLERVRESADVFRDLGATVDERIYPSMGHVVNRDELAAIAAVLRAAGHQPGSPRT